MRQETFPAGKLIFSEGDEGEEAYRILSGLVEVTIREGSQKVVLATLGKGETFGEMAMIEHRPRSATVRAIEDLEVEVISRTDFAETLQGTGEEMLPYLNTLFERLRLTNERLRSTLKELEALDPAQKPRVAEAKVVRGGPSVQLIPDSEETEAQGALQARKIKQFPFIFGRRGEVAGTRAVVQNQLLVADKSPFRVSRTHCQLECEAGSFYVRDQGSKLGSIVNGIGIGGPHREKSVRLSPGENSLILGRSDSQIRFKIIV